jgi:hypothetical protein
VSLDNWDQSYGGGGLGRESYWEWHQRETAHEIVMFDQFCGVGAFLKYWQVEPGPGPYLVRTKTRAEPPAQLGDFALGTNKVFDLVQTKLVGTGVG